MSSQPACQTPPPNLTAYKGSCHCTAITYKVLLPLPLASLQVTNCNCNLCTKNGYLNVYPKRKDVHIVGEENLASYLFSKTSCEHLFCKICGTSLFASPREVEGGEWDPKGFAVNVRGFVDVDLEGLQLRKYDGRAV